MRRITQSSEHSSFFPGRVAISFGGCHSFFAATVDGVKYRLAVMTLSLLCGITALRLITTAGQMNTTWTKEEITMTQLWSGISFAKDCFFGLIGAVPRGLFAAIAATALMGSPCVFGQTLTTLYNFGSHAHDGADPQAGVVFDETGNLYGATAIGGKAGSNGILFELKPTSLGLWSEIVLHKFQGRPDGKIPEGRVIFGSMGTLVGTTLKGGANDMGTVFAWWPSPDGSRSEKVLYSFGSIPNDAVQPNVGLIAAPSGFYGAAQGGANNTGAVYNLSPPIAGTRTWTETILYSFKSSGSGDAAFPSGELVSDANGNLYGATLLGGVNNLGAVFQLSPPAVQGDPWTETIIYSLEEAWCGRMPSQPRFPRSPFVDSFLFAGNPGVGRFGQLR